MYKVYEEGDKCPICNNIIISDIQGEDEIVIVQCSDNKKHYNRIIGYNDDLTE
jgi:hypothetical protein